VGELFGDTKVHTYAEIKARALKDGLEPIPAALAPEIRSTYEKGGQWTILAMEAIRDRVGNPSLFYCHSVGSKSWLNAPLRPRRQRVGRGLSFLLRAQVT